MKRIALSSLSLLLVACGGSTPPPQSTETAAAPPAPVEVQTPAPAETAAPAPAEDPKVVAEREKLAADRAAMLAEHQAEQSRLTPEVRADAKALTEKNYPNGKAAIAAAQKGKHRNPDNVARDADRHAVETMVFFGLQPSMTVLEYGPGGGWYTELLAPALANKGKLIVTTTDPNGPPEARATFYGERTKLFLEKAPEVYGKVEAVTIDPAAPDLKLDGSVDLALVIRGMHGMVNRGTLPAWLSEVHQALKPKGVLGIVQHRANPDAVAEEASKQGYLPQPWVIDQVQAAGFKLAAKSELNANPKDTKDYPEGVWTLPPTLRLGEQDRTKYEAIGESDRMTLKFVKVDAPPKS